MLYLFRPDLLDPSPRGRGSPDAGHTSKNARAPQLSETAFESWKQGRELVLGCQPFPDDLGR
jgi:hypothetical protein